MATKNRNSILSRSSQGSLASHDATQSEPSSYEQTTSNSSFHTNYSIEESFSDSLMMPEFMSEVPPNFESEWLCMPFPPGIRCSLIARSGITQARDAAGTLLDEFQSLLPGGSCFGTYGAEKTFSILDCIQVDAILEGETEPTQLVYFVLDMMAWNGNMFYNCSAESRFWMKSNWLSELEGANTINKANTSMRNDRLILSLPIYNPDRSGLLAATQSPIQLEIQILTPPPRLSQPAEPAEWNDAAASVDFYETPEPHTAPRAAAIVNDSRIEWQVEAIMFYYKDMDYVHETTPVMCLLPLAYAQHLIEEIDHEGDSNQAMNISASYTET